ncbi:DUF411 domain-containing protein [Halopseudomonas nanhaiensis]|nr:DUF411 domain-containing protein [Halopseudomonas nanhaiensis]
MARNIYMSIKPSKAWSAIPPLFFAAIHAYASSPQLTVEVHRDANCGCCKSWISYMESKGFEVIDRVEQDMIKVKSDLQVPRHLASCHTATLNGRFIEGHVPAAQVIELSKRSDLAGIAVPGMPAGSPGMEVPGIAHPYEVIGVSVGEEKVIATYP